MTFRRYKIGLTDPPWAYGSRCPHSDTKFGGGVHAHYDVMPTWQIEKLMWGEDPIGSIFAEDAALFLWTTGPHLQSGLDVLKAWGFRFVTIAFTWVKTTRPSVNPKKRAKLYKAIAGRVVIRWPGAFFGSGYYTASNAELCLLGIRGKMAPISDSVSQVIVAPHPQDAQGKIIHSRKPAIVRQRIVQLFGDVPRVEIFARDAAPGWEVLGNQLTDNPVTLTHQGAQLALGL